MYRSSRLTYFYKYIFVPLWGIGFLFGIIAFWSKDDQFSYDWSRSAALMVGWIIIWLIIMMIRLRSGEANYENFELDTFVGKKIVDYKDIEWIYQIGLISPILISVKYYDNVIGKSRKILIMPSTSEYFFRIILFGELEMTKFIRERIIAANPDYSKDLEPSRWLPAGLIILTAIPVNLIIEMYFSHF